MMQHKHERRTQAFLETAVYMIMLFVSVHAVMLLFYGCPYPVPGGPMRRFTLGGAESLINIDINANTNTIRDPLNVLSSQREKGHQWTKTTYNDGITECEYSRYAGSSQPVCHPALKHIHAVLPEHLHLVLEGLGLLSCGLGNLEHLHSHITMPPPMKHRAK